MRFDREQYERQCAISETFEAELIAFEDSIGCTRFQDEVICTREQAEQIAEWWKNRTAT